MRKEKTFSSFFFIGRASQGPKQFKDPNI